MSKLDFGSESAIAKEQSNLKAAESFLQNVTSCPNCGEFHQDLEFRRLPEPKSTRHGEVTHKGECPTLGLQILTGFLPSAQVVKQNKAEYDRVLSERLRTENMSEDDIKRVLQTMQSLGNEGALE